MNATELNMIIGRCKTIDIITRIARLESVKDSVREHFIYVSARYNAG